MWPSIVIIVEVIMFDHIQIKSWRQFDCVDIEFDSKMTVLTGANSSGKTTILNALGKHFGWEVPLIRSPFKTKREIVREFLDEHWDESATNEQIQAPSNAVGWIKYADKHKCFLVEPKGEDTKFSLQLSGSRPIRGVHIPSHRSIPGYAPVAQISTSPPTKAKAVDNYRREVLNRYLGAQSRKTPGQALKETVMTLCLLAQEGGRVLGWNQAAETISQFEEVLNVLLPSEFGFRKFFVDLPELYISIDGEQLIAFDAISGGIASLIDIAYQIFMYSPLGEPYVAVIDEPENHLHPAMQRRLLPDLTRAFPMVQFVVATHNPFIISSSRDARVYALVFESGKVVSRFLDTETKAGTASEILRDVLGLRSTLPIWVEEEMNQIIERYLTEGLTPESVERMRQEMIKQGLENQIVDALVLWEGGKKKR
jgi:AAA15 family ATPase/GTPase